MGKKSIFILEIMLVLLVISLAGNAPAADKKAQLAYVKWADAIATVHLAEAILEKKMGYEIELTAVDTAAMWQTLETGDIDAVTCAWLPGIHGKHLAGVKNNVEDLGPNLEGVKVGLVVPGYVQIKSIGELSANAEKFDNKIIGIDPGAGIMSMARDAIRTYGMDNMELIASSDAAMTAILEHKIKNGQWVVVTGWTPHWMFGKWDLKYIDDPKNVFGAEETINTVARKGLKEDKPDLFSFLDAFKLSLDDIHEIMAWNKENGSPELNAVRWMDQNPDKVANWLP